MSVRCQWATTCKGLACSSQSQRLEDLSDMKPDVASQQAVRLNRLDGFDTTTESVVFYDPGRGLDTVEGLRRWCIEMGATCMYPVIGSLGRLLSSRFCCRFLTLRGVTHRCCPQVWLCVVDGLAGLTCSWCHSGSMSPAFYLEDLLLLTNPPHQRCKTGDITVYAFELSSVLLTPYSCAVFLSLYCT
jgi:hypothetical protein